ncbi:hypothetical protein DTO164E3_3494 [Paecilomyces variotii]|nr:hypothetical protein DTO164E3_3494 [Paecilomyces variotii]KAJ9268126.1 hypothetical protein DTO212C5_5814 [Paecilomyces variotii]KAJ9279821.1 hypothetical protein DTO021D3_3326 [Paecilomyces variotii]KAJ9382068.1 hypothetical protein DTO032I4_5874 [Paecilomyces variotii]
MLRTIGTSQNQPTIYSSELWISRRGNDRAIGRSLELAPGVIHRARLFRFHSFSSAYGLCRPRLVAIAQGIVREGNEKRSGQGDGPCSRCSVPSMFMNPPSIMLGTPEQNGAFHTGG